MTEAYADIRKAELAQRAEQGVPFCAPQWAINLERGRILANRRDPRRQTILEQMAKEGRL